jgi:hypothetical protein
MVRGKGMGSLVGWQSVGCLVYHGIHRLESEHFVDRDNAENAGSPGAVARATN